MVEKEGDEVGCELGDAPALPRMWISRLLITVEGRHFIQESSGATIGKGIAAWIKEKSL